MATDATWPASPVYRQRESLMQKAGAATAAVGRLVLPVLLLVSAFAAIYLYIDTPLSPALSSNVGLPSWLTTGFAIVPVAFFAIELTNRRYGAGYAFVQVVISSAIVAGVALLSADSLQGLLPVGAEPSFRIATSFGVAFFVASFLSILVFDGARGPRWWVAPLLGSLTWAIVFPVLFWPSAFAGATPDWTRRMFVDLGFMTGTAVALLLPYWGMRRLVPPLSGFGGY